MNVDSKTKARKPFRLLQIVLQRISLFTRFTARHIVLSIQNPQLENPQLVIFWVSFVITHLKVIDGKNQTTDMLREMHKNNSMPY